MSFLGFIPRQSRRIVKLDCLSAILGALISGGIYPFVGVIARKDLHASALTISLISSAPYLGCLLSPLWAARAEAGRKVWQVISTQFIARIALLLLAIAGTAYSFAAIVIISVLVPNLSMPAYIALVKDLYADEWRGRITAIVRVISTVASMAAASLVGILLTHWRYQVVLPIVALVSMIGPACFSRIREPKTVAEHGTRPSLRETFALLQTDPHFKRFSVVFFVFGFGNIMTSPLIPILQVDRLHITAGWVGALATLSTLSCAIAYYFWGKTVDRRGPFVCGLACMFGWGTVAAGYALAPNLLALIPIAILAGITSAANDLAVINGLMQFGDGRQVARYSSVQYALLGVRGTIAPLLGGILVGCIPIQAIFAICSGLIFCGALLMIRMMRFWYADQAATELSLAISSEALK